MLLLQFVNCIIEINNQNLSCVKLVKFSLKFENFTDVQTSNYVNVKYIIPSLNIGRREET